MSKRNDANVGKNRLKRCKYVSDEAEEEGGEGKAPEESDGESADGYPSDDSFVAPEDDGEEDDGEEEAVNPLWDYSQGPPSQVHNKVDLTASDSEEEEVKQAVVAPPAPADNAAVPAAAQPPQPEVHDDGKELPPGQDDVDIGQPATKGKFDFRKVRGHFTYKGHIDKDVILKHMGKTTKVASYSIVHEEGAHRKGERPYKHTHALIRWGEAMHVRKADWFDIGGVHPHIQHVDSVAHWSNLVEYHTKAPLGLWTFNTDQGVANPQKDAIEALKTLVGRRATMLEIYEHPAVAVAAQRYPAWFKSVLPLVRQQPEDNFVLSEKPEHSWWIDAITIAIGRDDYAFKYPARTGGRWIFWFWSAAARTGKTTVANHIVSECGTSAQLVKNTERLGTMVHGYVEALCPPIVVFDCGRADPVNEKSAKTFMENLKDGAVTSTMYGGGVQRFQPCTIFVFANEPPQDEFNGGLSADRLSETTFDISEIEDRKKLHALVEKNLVPVPKQDN